MTRLSEGMSEDGFLKPVPMRRTVEALSIFAEEIRTANAAPFAVATAAVRKAKNQAEFLQLVKEQAGFDLFVISGEAEAYFDFQGVMAGFEEVKDCLICDTGGGSCELILVKNRCMKEKISLPFGAMSLTDCYGQNTSDAADFIKAQFDRVPFLEDAKGVPLIGVGGSVFAMGMVDIRQKGLETADLHGHQLTPHRMEELFTLLSAMTIEERIAHGVEPARADSVCHGFLPSLLLAKRIQSPHLSLCSHGLREGILYELLQDRPEFYACHPEQFLEKYV